MLKFKFSESLQRVMMKARPQEASSMSDLRLNDVFKALVKPHCQRLPIEMVQERPWECFNTLDKGIQPRKKRCKIHKIKLLNIK